MSNEFPLAIPSDLLRIHLIAGIVTDPRFLQVYHTHLDSKYFASREEQWLVDVALEHYAAYTAAPGHSVIRMELDRQQTTGEIDAPLAENIERLLTAIPTIPRPEDKHLRDYTFKQTGDFLRKEAIILAAQYVLDDVKKGRADRIVRLMEDAVSVGKTDDRQMYRLFADAEKWLMELEDTEKTVTPTAIPALDNVLNGGARPGELMLWMAPTNYGKSHGLIWVGKVAALVGRRVLHLTLEMPLRQVMARYAAGVTNIESNRVWDRWGEVLNKLAREGEMYAGDVIVEQFAPRGLSVSFIRQMLDEYSGRGEPIDFLVVDYGDILRPAQRLEKTYLEQGRIFEDLRGVGVDYNIPIWSAVQSGRQGHSKDEMDASDVGESYDKAKIADFICTMVQNAEQRVNGEMTLSPIKARTGKAGGKVYVNVDWRTSTIQEIDPAFEPDDDYFRN